jgi:DNA-binding LacI/PurR family transcriptional regulator
MKNRLSIRDIAGHLGVSHTTVSLALRNSVRLTPAMRQRVQRAAKKLGYHTDATVSALMARLRTIRITSVREALGFITAWPTRSGWRSAANHARFFDGARRQAHELGYSLDEFWLHEDGMTGRRMTRILRARGIRGLVLHSLPNVGGRLKLDWQYFACVTKGLTVQYPPVHRIVSSHYEDMHLVLTELASRCYRRIGLVLGEALSARVDRAWLASFLLHQNDTPPENRIPALIARPGIEKNGFAQWFDSFQPDVVLFSEQPVVQWLKQRGTQVPQNVGLVHLDWSRSVAPLAGLDSDPEAIGVAAIDLLVGQLQASEFGIPKHEKIIAVRGHWVAGSSVRARK